MEIDPFERLAVARLIYAVERNGDGWNLVAEAGRACDLRAAQMFTALGCVGIAECEARRVVSMIRKSQA